MKVIKIIALLFSILYIGCGENEQKELDTHKLESNNSGVNMTSNIDVEDVLSQLGLDITDAKMSFDMNKTTNFLKKMEIEMHGKADSIQHKIEKADINFTRDMGINFSGKKLEIDLNKTRNMFQEINILMKEVLLDKNSSKY